MSFKILFIAAFVALAHAGHPAEYIISAPSADHASVGSSQEHTIKGHYGQNAHSEYSSVANTAHSTSHVARTSINNDVIGYGGHVAAPAIAHAAYAAPAVAHVAAPAIAPAIAHVAAPAYAHAAYAAPALRVAAPAISYAPAHTYAAHVAAAPAVAHVAAPAISYAHGGALYGHGRLAYGHGLGLGYGYGYRAAYAGPIAAAHYAAPIAAAHYAAPYASPYAVKAAVAAPVVHTSILGHGGYYAH